jgi:hypothetical protein
MRYVAILLIATASIFNANCAEGDTNKTSATNNNSTTASTAPVAKEANLVGENECRICAFDMAAYKGELKNPEVEGLLLALNDEYLATATYQQVNKDFGDPGPFVNIVRAEMRHAEMLKELCTKYGVPVPENPWPGNVPKFSSVADACKAGVEGEIMNRDLYTRLSKSTERKDILDTYRNLQRASEENHLPAFERCGGGGRGPRGNG